MSPSVTALHIQIYMAHMGTQMRMIVNSMPGDGSAAAFRCHLGWPTSCCGPDGQAHSGLAAKPWLGHGFSGQASRCRPPAGARSHDVRGRRQGASRKKASKDDSGQCGETGKPRAALLESARETPE